MSTAPAESEYRTRRDRIDPLLKAQGWTILPHDPDRPLARCTRAAGVAVWVVATGSDDREALARANPDRLLKDLHELPALLDGR